MEEGLNKNKDLKENSQIKSEGWNDEVLEEFETREKSNADVIGVKNIDGQYVQILRQQEKGYIQYEIPLYHKDGEDMAFADRNALGNTISMTTEKREELDSSAPAYEKNQSVILLLKESADAKLTPGDDAKFFRTKEDLKNYLLKIGLVLKKK